MAMIFQVVETCIKKKYILLLLISLSTLIDCEINLGGFSHLYVMHSLFAVYLATVPSDN